MKYFTHVSLYKIVFILVLAALFIRLGAFFQTPVINDDGPLYIHQARAITSGLWDSTSNCVFPYLSLYPFIIAAFHVFIRDWVIAAQLVSIIFGSLSVIPLFLIIRRFFDIKISLLTTLIFALNPLLVDTSIDIAKDAPGWLFSLTAMYFFVRFSDEKKLFYLPLSSLFFFIAILLRIEMTVYIIATFVWLVVYEKEKKLTAVLYFTAPFLIILTVALLGLIITKEADLSLIQSYFIPRINQLTYAMGNYKIIELQLEKIKHITGMRMTGLFLSQLKDVLWLVPAIIILKKIVDTFFLPFFVIFIVGFTQIRAKNNRLVSYFLILSLFCLAFLYGSYLLTWVISKRYIVIFLLAAFPFMGYGMMNLIRSSAIHKIRKLAVILILVVIFMVTIIKDLKPERESKMILKEIGTYISRMEYDSDEEIKIVSSEGLILFYANIDKEGAPCPRSVIDYKNIIKKLPRQVIELFRKKGIKYFIYEERMWKGLPFRISHLSGIELVKKWKDRKKGILILYKLR